MSYYYYPKMKPEWLTPPVPTYAELLADWKERREITTHRFQDGTWGAFMPFPWRLVVGTVQKYGSIDAAARSVMCEEKPHATEFDACAHHGLTKEELDMYCFPGGLRKRVSVEPYTGPAIIYI